MLVENNIKICTATFFSASAPSYGAFLQAWALQQFLGESNYILNLPLHWPSFVGENGRRKLPFFWRLIALWRYFLRYYLRKGCFDEFNTLNLTSFYHTTKEIVKNPPQADVYITGSDQVWNRKIILIPDKDIYNNDIYFLAFGPSNVKRIAYAASMGEKEWPATFTQQVLPHLRKFNAISVREESSVPFLNSIGLENVAVTCDPTILHTADFYRSHFSHAQNKCYGCIFVYRIKKEFPISIQKFFDTRKIVEPIINKHKLVSVTQWLHNIDTCDAVITDSFHGTVFSILFHKPFISLLSNNRNERKLDLLRKVNLEYRLLSGNETHEEIEEILYRPVNWEQVDAILEEWRSYSENWLKEALYVHK